MRNVWKKFWSFFSITSQNNIDKIIEELTMESGHFFPCTIIQLL